MPAMPPVIIPPPPTAPVIKPMVPPQTLDQKYYGGMPDIDYLESQARERLARGKNEQRNSMTNTPEPSNEPVLTLPRAPVIPNSIPGGGLGQFRSLSQGRNYATQSGNNQAVRQGK